MYDTHLLILIIICFIYSCVLFCVMLIDLLGDGMHSPFLTIRLWPYFVIIITLIIIALCHRVCTSHVNGKADNRSTRERLSPTYILRNQVCEVPQQASLGSQSFTVGPSVLFS
jgi:hypothetical protein